MCNGMPVCVDGHRCIVCVCGVRTATAKRRQLNRVTFKLSDVVVNAKAMMQAVDELEPLATVMPSDSNERSKYVSLRCPT